MGRYLSIAVMETRQALIDVINGSGIPGCVMQMILGDITGAVDAMAQREYQMDLEARAAEREEERTDGDSDDPEQTGAEG